MKNDSLEALGTVGNKLNLVDPLYRIVRDDLQEDAITKLQFSCYNDAYDDNDDDYDNDGCDNDDDNDDDYDDNDCGGYN